MRDQAKAHEIRVGSDTQEGHLMTKRNRAVTVPALLAIPVIVFMAFGGAKARSIPAGESTPGELIGLFREWREFQKPRVVEGVPDYTAAAMKEKARGLVAFRQRLAAIDPREWPLSKKVDYNIVRAEMNGMDFEHRVIRPWSRDPAFYAVIADSEPDVPAREGPEIFGALGVWDLKLPLADKDIAAFRIKLRAIPRILEQARKNLIEESRDLWTLGIRQKTDEARALSRLASRLAGPHPDIVPDVERAKASVQEFLDWLEKKREGMGNIPCGVGIDDFNWSMKYVHLVPYTWEEQLRFLQRELERSLACLALEQHRNRDLPPLEPAVDGVELKRRFDGAMSEFMSFLRDGHIFTVPDYMKLDPLRGGYFAPPGERDFFAQIDYRDPLPMRCHMFHWLEKQRMIREPHPNPIRTGPLLYNIWDSRSEGLATGLEEMLMHAGLLDRHPRSRELVYILVAMRAVRAIGDLRLNSREFGLEEAVRYAVDKTPNGWLQPEGDTVWIDMGIYLRQPGYGTSYIIGKAQIGRLLADRSRQMGAGFSLQRFMDDFFAAGIIPVSLIRWEMTGLDDEMKILK
jgi:hypothetical protein